MIRNLLFLAFFGLAQHFSPSDAHTGQCQGNIIPGGITSESSNHNGDRPADRATISDPNSWWRIDLQGLFEVTCINIQNGHTQPLTGTEIIITNSTNEQGRKCNQIDTPLSNDNKNFTCFQPTLGRYITIRHSSSGFIVLCDVKIYAKIGWRLIKENKTWDEAAHYCKDRGMKLVSIPNNNIQDFVALVAQEADSPFVWLGLRYFCSLEVWFWVDSHNSCYRKWAPEDGWMRQCLTSAAMEAKGNNDWFIKFIHERFNFICEL